MIFFFLRRAHKGDKVGEKGGAGGGGGDSPPEVDQTDDVTDDLMAENGEIPRSCPRSIEFHQKSHFPFPFTSLSLRNSHQWRERRERQAREKEEAGEPRELPDFPPRPVWPVCLCLRGVWPRPAEPHPVTVRERQKKRMDGRKWERGMHMLFALFHGLGILQCNTEI